MKRLFVMRHGEAVAQADTDASRELSPQGRKDITAMAQRYGDDLAVVDQVWVSPYVRAQQTAELVVTHIDRPLITHSWLTPTDNPDQVLEALRQADTNILVISHQPLVGTLVDRLAGLETGRYRMGTGAIAGLEYDILASGCAELLWLHQALNVSH